MILLEPKSLHDQFLEYLESEDLFDQYDPMEHDIPTMCYYEEL